MTKVQPDRQRSLVANMRVYRDRDSISWLETQVGRPGYDRIDGYRGTRRP